MSLMIGEYFRPRTLDEALTLLAEGDGSRQALAGGTAMMLLRGTRQFDVVDLWGIDLGRIEEVEGGIEIGAMVTVNQLAKHSAVSSYAGGVVANACRNLASTSLRNLITIGGNLVQLHPWSDLPPVFMALEAEITISSPGGKRTIPSEAFFSQHPRTVLKSGELVTSILLPEPDPGLRACFTKFRTNQVDYSLVTSVCSLSMTETGHASNVHVVAGALGVSPTRFAMVEELLEGQEPTDELIGRAAERAREDANPSRDMRVSADYRREIFSVLVKRQLRSLRDDHICHCS